MVGQLPTAQGRAGHVAQDKHMCRAGSLKVHAHACVNLKSYGSAGERCVQAEHMHAGRCDACT